MRQERIQLANELFIRAMKAKKEGDEEGYADFMRQRKEMLASETNTIKRFVTRKGNAHSRKGE